MCGGCAQGHFCNWYGIICTLGLDNETFFTIKLSVNNLKGTLPASLGWLCNLQGLILPANQLQGVLPPFGAVCDMPFLQVIDLTANHLSGTIPESYGADSLLLVFDPWGGTQL
jgi:hypothetical protein